MSGTMRLALNNNGTYDLLVEYNSFDSEFGLDFFSKERLTNSFKNISDFIKKNADQVKISAIKIVVGGLTVASIPFGAVFNASAEADARYSMAYLYGGTANQQIQYVQQTNSALQTVSPSYFDINKDGSLKVNTPSKTLITQMHSQNIKVVPFLSNHWDRQTGINALANADKLSTQIAETISEYNLDGINVDIENVTEAQRDQYSNFIKLLRKKIPPEKEISVAVAANPKGWKTGWQGSYDYKVLAENSDYLMIMAYDEHYNGSKAGPVASLQFVEQSIQYALKHTTPDKIAIGLPLYGRIWSSTNDSIQGRAITTKNIPRLINSYKGTVSFNTTSRSPYANFEIGANDSVYKLSDGSTLTPGKYVVWYENEQSIREKLNLIEKYNLKGSGFWALGQEDPSIWGNLNAEPKSEEPETDSEFFTYTVQSGDTLSKLAKKYGTSVSAIKSLNGLKSDVIRIGKQLKIPQK